MYRKWNRHRPTWYKNLYRYGHVCVCMTWARDIKIGHFWLASFRSIIEIEFLMGLKWKLNDSTQIGLILKNFLYISI